MTKRKRKQQQQETRETTMTEQKDVPTTDNPALTRVGAKGVHLKQFEEVVADLLPTVRPSFHKLPHVPDAMGNENWPFDKLPSSARVSGTAPGQLSGKRATRKEGQLRSLLRCIVAMLPEQKQKQQESELDKKITIVDFCGGTGWLSIPLALILPQCEVVIVDLKAASLNYVHKKAIQCSRDESQSIEIEDVYDTGKHVTEHDLTKRRCRGIPNLYTFHGSIESYNEDFDIGCALHACGEASDIVLRKCGESRANVVVSPCCVGKLNRQAHNPYIYHATAGNKPTISYPQSNTFSSLLKAPQWDALAKAADYSDIAEIRTPRNAARRTAKALLETDRLFYIQKQYGYQSCLTRMEPWEASPKNDILLGWFQENQRVGSPYQYSPYTSCMECNADIKMSEDHLFATGDGAGSAIYCKEVQGDSVDWTLQQQEETRKELQTFIDGEEQEKYFPTGLGRNRRKLIHFVAGQMSLIHLSHGKKASEKTVLIKKRPSGK